MWPQFNDQTYPNVDSSIIKMNWKPLRFKSDCKKKNHRESIMTNDSPSQQQTLVWGWYWHMLRPEFRNLADHYMVLWFVSRSQPEVSAVHATGWYLHKAGITLQTVTIAASHAALDLMCHTLARLFKPFPQRKKPTWTDSTCHNNNLQLRCSHSSATVVMTMRRSQSEIWLDSGW